VRQGANPGHTEYVAAGLPKEGELLLMNAALRRTAAEGHVRRGPFDRRARARYSGRRWLLSIGVALCGVLLSAGPGRTGTLTASWTAPTTNTDGSALTDLASYNLYYGLTNSPCPGSTFVTVPSSTPSPGPNLTVTQALTGLVTGSTYFAAVTAVATSGAQSACSTVASAVARIDFAVTPTGTVNFGTVNIGSSADQTFTVQNLTLASISGTVTTSAPFSIVSGGAFTVGAGSTTTVTVRFTPTVAATASTNVTFTANGGSVSSAVTGTGNDPTPTLTSLSPSTATAGGAAFTLTATGTNFVAASVVQWNGSARTTTFVSSTQLRAAITAADITTAGTAAVTVFTPAPGGGTSTASTFTITASNPAPTLGSLSPTTAIAGGAAFTLTATGTNFVAASVVQWNGSARTTTFVSSTQLQVAITAADIATAGTAAVTVFTPAPGGGTSTASTFTITASNPAPTLGSLSPNTATAGGAAFTLSATGTNFVAASVVQWNGSARTTTFVSSTQLQAAITAADIATAGTAAVTVFTPAPGGGTSTASTFTITASNPAPTLTSLSPNTAAAGGAAFTLSATGTNFVAASVVRWNGTARTTTFVSSTQLQAAITAADIATAGTAAVTVFTPAPGGGTSTASTFTITASNPAPTLTSLSPNTATAGGAAFTLTATGTNFVAASVVQWNGTARTTTFVSSTQLQAAITAADIATAGTAAVTVFTPAPGGGTSTPSTFTIAAPNPVPALGTLAPGSVTAGNGAFTLTVGGSNFVPTSTVMWSGASRTTTFVSATQLSAAITAADVLNAGTAQVTVTTPAPGGGTSVALAFVINPASTLNVGLVAYWPFDQTSGTIAPDASGNGNTGTLLNGPVWTTGQIGQALAFDGVAAFVQAPNAAPLDAFPLTIAAWINTAARTGGIVNKYLASSFNGYDLFLSNGSLCASYYRDPTDFVADTTGCPLNTPGFNDGRWHQVVYIVDAVGGRLYVDSVQRASMAWTGTAGAASTTQPVDIGNDPGAVAGAQFFAGTIDDVRVYNRALSPTEVSQLYASGVVTTGTTPPLITAVSATAVGTAGATVTWTTDQPSDTQVDFGVTASYGLSTPLNTGLVTSHGQAVTGLGPGVIYHFRVHSRNASGDIATSADYTFRTMDVPGAKKHHHHKNWFDELVDSISSIF